MDGSALALVAAPPDTLRYSLQALLASLPQIAAVHSVEDAHSMFAALAALQPRLIVLDISLVGDGSGQLLAQITTITPRTHSVVLVDRIEQQQALQMTSADLVLLKGYPAAELFRMIEQLLAQDEPGTSQPSATGNDSD